MQPTAVVQQLDRLARQIGEPGLTAEVIEACSKGQALLYLQPDGFVVLKVQMAPVPSALVWVVYSDADQVLARYYASLVAWARGCGLRRLIAWTKRPGLVRWLTRQGWQACGENEFEVWIDG